MKRYIKSNYDAEYENMSDLPEFTCAFAVTRMIIFEVAYYTLGSNRHPYFTTSAWRFNRPKSDFSQGGQGQESLLPHASRAYRFYKKWNAYHLKELSPELYDEMRADLDGLLSYYPNIFKEFDITQRPYPSYSTNISFYDLKKLSMGR